MADKEEAKEAPKKQKDKAAPVKDEKKDLVDKTQGKEKEKEKDKKKDLKKEGKKEEKKEHKEPKRPKDDKGAEIRHIIRIADTDIDGTKSVQYALTGIPGISRRTAKIIAETAGLDCTATMGYLTEPDIDKIKSTISGIDTVLPAWMLNRQNDLLTGDDRHVYGTDVLITVKDDINLMKKIRSYKGVRHERGLKVRGQRTRSTGRKGRTVGVQRMATIAAKKEEAAAAQAEKGVPGAKAPAAPAAAAAKGAPAAAPAKPGAKAAAPAATEKKPQEAKK